MPIRLLPLLVLLLATATGCYDFESLADLYQSELATPADERVELDAGDGHGRDAGSTDLRSVIDLVIARWDGKSFGDSAPPADLTDTNNPTDAQPFVDQSQTIPVDQSVSPIDQSLPVDQRPPRDQFSGSDGDTSKWTRQTSGFKGNLYAVWAAGGNVAYAAGVGGSVLRTGDGGGSWASQATATSKDLLGLWGAGKLVIACGGATTFTRSDDAGMNWSGLDYFGTEAFHGIFGLPGTQEVVSVATGGEVFRSSDSGANWTSSPSGISKNLFGVWAASATGVYAVGDTGAIYYSNNHAMSWTAQNSTAPTSELWSIWGSGPTDIYVVGSSGTVLHSNGNAKWTSRDVGLLGINLYGVWGSGPNDVYLVGQNDTILHSTNQGVTWTNQPSGTGAAWFGVSGSGPNDVYIVGQGGAIVHGP